MTLALLRPSSADAIDKCIAQVAVAFQRHIDPVVMRVYRTALSDLPIEVIEAAALQLQRKGGTFFPTTAQWHQVAEEIRAERTRETLAQSQTRDENVYEHEDCHDTGWLEVEGRNRICPCRATNRTYRRLTLSSRKAQNEEVKR